MKKRKILIIDDEKWIRKALIDILSKHGYETEYSENGKDALEKLNDYRPDLVISDINMPLMNGYEFLKKFRAIPENKEIPVIILSVKGKPEDVIKGFKFGADQYIAKPCPPSTILSHVETTLRMAPKHPSIYQTAGLPGDKKISGHVNNRLTSECIKNPGNHDEFNE